MRLLPIILFAVLVSIGDRLPADSSTATAKPSVQIVEVLPFAGGDNVRIEVTLKANTPVPIEEVEIKASIIPWPEGETLWKGSLGTVDLAGAEEKKVTKHVTDLEPARWSPAKPNLYNLVVEAARDKETLATTTTRFGFRSVETREGQIYLNGKPIFLRGNAINPPGRGVPDEVGSTRAFAEAYVRDMKRRNVNLIRPGRRDHLWLEVCDELGMMVFWGCYGAPPGGAKSRPPADFEDSLQKYKSWFFEICQRHPSLIISILTNEMPRRGETGAAYDDYLERVWQILKPWDPNRLYIGNAGFGRGHGGDIYDVHPYLGWYAGSFIDLYRLRKPYDLPAARPLQPVTLSECVGAYTTDAGRFSIYQKQLATALAWTGHATDQNAAGLEYQAFLTGQFIEILRRVRSVAPTIAGVMPFTYMFSWGNVESLDEVKAKPAADQMRISYQPILLSWENWNLHAYAGTEVRVTAHIVNDSDEAEDLLGARLKYVLKDTNDEIILSDQLSLPDIPYYAAREFPIKLPLPPTLTTGEYILVGEVIAGADHKTISSNKTTFFVASKGWPNGDRVQERKVILYDPVGKTASALTALGFKFSKVEDIGTANSDSVLVIGENCWDSGVAEKGELLKAFIREGGRLLLLRQKGNGVAFDWLPTVVTSAEEGEGLWINPERPGHPVFSGIERERLRYWNDYTNWNHKAESLPQVSPVTSRLRLQESVDFAATAVLADYHRSLHNIALCQVFDGKGSAIISGFDLVNRSGLDPISDRLLCNLVFYAASSSDHQRHPVIDSPILWGDYTSERGVVTGPFHGLLENWDDLKARIPGFERRPGTGSGRRPFGWYDLGGGTGTYIIDRKPDSKTASGIFCATIPTGRKNVVTVVANPGDTPATLELETNGKRSGETSTIPAGKVVKISNPLPPDVTSVCLKYTGNKSLVLLETSFE